MKYIVLDTNILFNNWFLDNLSFQLLLNYMENTGSILLLPELVCEEVQNKYETELKSARTSFEKVLNQLSEFYPEKLNLPIEEYQYDFITQLKSKVQGTVIFGYKDLNNTAIVRRAIHKILPFREQDRGFRDTLIWLSTLSYLRKSNISDPVVFITKNYTDYFDKELGQFRPELINDINSHQLLCTIEPFSGLQSFFATLSIEEYKSVEMKDLLDRVLGDNEREIEVKIEDYINQLSSPDVQKLFSLKLRYPYMDTLLDFNFEILEGIENLKVERRYKLNDGKYYVTCDLELRACTFLFGIPQNDYLTNKTVFDDQFLDHYLAEDEFAYFFRYIRPRMKINLLVDPVTEDIIKVEIVDATFTIKK